jgi:hypothetical protein
MKKLLLTTAFAAIASWSFGQVIFKGISPAAVQNLFEFNVQANEGGWPDETDDGTWAMSLDFNQPGVYVQGELMLVEDGTPGINPQGNPISQEGCNPLTNDLTGKIAVVYRNTCSFGSKVAYAQDAGAIAVMVINREDVPLGMLADPLFPNDTIPAIIVSNTDGEFIVSVMETGPVVMFLGNKIGVNADDMAIGKPDVIMAESYSNPLALAQNGTELNIDLGLWAYNIGVNPQTGVIFDVDVEFGGSSVYSQTSAPTDFVGPVGLTLDTQYIDLGNYAPASWNVGTYTITYTITTQNQDGDMSDNEVISQFKVTSDNIYSKSRTDASNQPIRSTAYSLNESTTLYDRFETCVQFKNPNASRLEALGITYSCTPVGTKMDGEFIEIRAYEWNDVFTDANDPAFPAPQSSWTLNQVGAGFDFYSGESENGVNKYLAFDEAPITLVDNQRYLFCVYNESDSLRIGFDAQIDYTSTVNNYLEYSSPVGNLPNNGTMQWYAAGFGFDASPALTVNFDEVGAVGVEDAAINNTVAPYPNPVANLLTIPVRKHISGNVTVEVFDVAGKLVLTENKVVGTEKIQINVASIANGSYVFKTTFANGTTDSFKVSVNR